MDSIRNIDHQMFSLRIGTSEVPDHSEHQLAAAAHFTPRRQISHSTGHTSIQRPEPAPGSGQKVNLSGYTITKNRSTRPYQQVLAEHGIAPDDIGTVGHKGWSFKRFIKGEQLLTSAIKKIDLELINALIEAGVKIEYWALHYAAGLGVKKAVEVTRLLKCDRILMAKPLFIMPPKAGQLKPCRYTWHTFTTWNCPGQAGVTGPGLKSFVIMITKGVPPCTVPSVVAVLKRYANC